MNDILDDILTSTRKLHRLLSYADALTHGIRRMGHIDPSPFTRAIAMNDILDDILTSTRKLHRLLSYADALTHGIRRMGHIDPSPFTRAIAMNDILDDILTSTRKLHRLLSYADALTHGIRRMGHIEVDGLRFERQGHELNADGRHTLTYELAGTGKLYHVTIEPVAETHR